jgi:dienelactone hydrolase
MKTLLAILAVLMFLPVAALAEIRMDLVEYDHDGTTLEGLVAYDTTKAGPSPGVLIVHQWKGITTHERDIALRLAEMGYVAFCADIYGKGVRPETSQAAGAEAGKYRKDDDRSLFRGRLNAGLEQLLANPRVDAQRVAAIGYCFGGTGVLELARSGAPIAGVVSFHGSLDSTNPEDGKNIHAKVLVLHGADDPYVPQAGIDAMIKEFNDGGVDWQMISYGGAVHSFTDRRAAGPKETGAMYDADADRRSWEHMKVFFAEFFE